MNVFLIVLAYFAFGFFLLVCIIKVVNIARMPVHLRWELAPIPSEKGRNKYGGSYLEEYEWWNKKHQKSLMPVIIFMAKEIFLQNGVWKNNRTLWPFSFSMHNGIYLVILSFLFHILNALFIINNVPLGVIDVFRSIAAIVALAGYILGSFGALGLIIKRATDKNLKSFSSFSVFFKLVFLLAIFISGILSWCYSSDFASETSLFTSNLLTLDSSITITIYLTAHIIISLLFLMYLPLTDMVHFITKFFTYHAVRWNDEPLNKKMGAKLSGLMDQPVSWPAAHIKSDGKKNWTDIITGEHVEEEKP